MDPVIIASTLTLGLLGLIFGSGLAYASKKFAVEKDPRLDKIVDIMPGANCGGCGYAGCNAFAEAVLKGEAPITGCGPGGRELAENLSKILGVEVGEIVDMVAVTRCQGSPDKATDRFEYHGIKDCSVAHRTGAGHKSCIYGCLGFGNCKVSCPFDAITMSKDNLPVVDKNKCTGCGACVTACPRNIMKLIPVTQQVYVGCVNPNKAKAVKSVCSIGCIGCTLCAKVTPSGSITMNGNLPEIDPSGTDLVIAVHKCPTSSLVDRIRVRAKVSIDSSCDGCGKCKAICPAKGAIEGEEGIRHRVVFNKCIGCGICIPVCPHNSIHTVGALGYQESKKG